MVLGAGGVEPRPYGGQEDLCKPGVGRPPLRRVARSAVGRADVGIGPYGSITRGAMGGRPQGPPLRKRNKKCGGERNPPGTASPCLLPLGKGAYKDGGYGLPRPVCALASQ